MSKKRIKIFANKLSNCFLAIVFITFFASIPYFIILGVLSNFYPYLESWIFALIPVFVIGLSFLLSFIFTNLSIDKEKMKDLKREKERKERERKLKEYEQIIARERRQEEIEKKEKERYKEQKKPRYISKEVRREVWRRDQGRCVECSSRERLEFDHIIPASKGGSNTARNIQLLCEKCNRKKYNKIGF